MGIQTSVGSDYMQDVATLRERQMVPVGTLSVNLPMNLQGQQMLANPTMMGLQEHCRCGW